MFDTSRFLLFLSAALVLAITPGPGIFYVMARSLAGGRREGLLSAVGTLGGGLVHVTAAALGLSALLAASAVAFNVVRYTGAAYLVWLGIGMIRRRNEDHPEPSVVRGVRRSPLLQGVLTEVLNPKTALFFLSFIPQFVSLKHPHVVAQFLVLGAISVLLNTGADVVVALFAGPLGAHMKRHASFRRRQRTACGVAMIGLGAYVAVADSR
jgi:threonine/homoserine/homoserine lactone efflux protein